MKLVRLSYGIARSLGWPTENAFRRALGRAAKVEDDGVVRARLGPVLGVKIGSRWRVVVVRERVRPRPRLGRKT
jgi:hypothetical protein